MVFVTIGLVTPSTDGAVVAHGDFTRIASHIDHDPVAAPQPARCNVTLTLAHDDTSTPLLVGIGASFTAGVGAGNPDKNWAVRLTQLLGWRAMTIGVPGAGYVNPGTDRLGPLRHELALIRLRALHPSIVIIQAGHDDWRVPKAREAKNVAELIKLAMAEAPHARLAFITAFSNPDTPSTEQNEINATNATIMSTIATSDPGAIVINPADWHFARVDHGLHPTAAGYAVIAHDVAQALFRAGAISNPRDSTTSTVTTCWDLGNR
jgi:lysophospholipase L1-like esterase